MSEQIESAEYHNPLRLDRCPDCGYLLTGLPERGICPECGFSYRPDMIVLYGWGQTRASRDWPILAKLAFYAAAGALLFALHVLLKYAGVGYSRVPGGLVVLVAAILMDVSHQYRKKRLAAEGLAGDRQLRIFPEGFGFRRSFGACTLKPWRQARRHVLMRRKNGSYWLKLWSTSWFGPHEGIEFKCQPEDAKRLVERIESYLKVARGKQERVGQGEQ